MYIIPKYCIDCGNELGDLEIQLDECAICGCAPSDLEGDSYGEFDDGFDDEPDVFGRPYYLPDCMTLATARAEQDY